MADNSNSTVYIGHLDERVTDRVLYDILIQAGRVVELTIPRDKETGKPKGYAFADYETPEIADYAVKLFSGLVTLYNRTLKFGISGQDKPQNSSTSGLTQANAFYIPRSQRTTLEYNEISPRSERYPGPHLVSAHPSHFSDEPPPPGVTPSSNDYGSFLDSSRRRDFRSSFDDISRSRQRRYDTREPM